MRRRSGCSSCARPRRCATRCWAHLARHGIFAPVHWRQDRAGLWSGDDEAADLASRMLTVPVDHRCGPDDVRRIAEVLRAFAAEAATRAAA